MSEKMSFPSPIRLLVGPGEGSGHEAGNPFVQLSSDAHPFQAYLACLEVDGRVIVPHLTILLEPNEYPGSRISGVRAPIGNRQVEEICRRGFRRHRKLES